MPAYDICEPTEPKPAHGKMASDDVTLRHIMKTQTKDLHSVADTAFEEMIFKKNMSEEAYKVYISQLYYLYKGLEEVLELNKDHEFVGPIYMPAELNRTEACERDMSYFYGQDWSSKITCLPAVKSYVKWLHHLGETKPEMLVPHAYVRYFGDLSGGQILKRIFKRLYQLPEDGTGLEFYDFSHIQDIASFKEFFANRLNALELSENEREAMVEETRRSFELNIDMIQELDRVIASMPNGYLPAPLKSKHTPNGVCSHANGSTPRENGVNPHQNGVAPVPDVKTLVPDSKNGDITKVIVNTSLAMLGFAMMVTACPWMRNSVLGV